MRSPRKGRTGLARAWNATRYSLAGLAASVLLPLIVEMLNAAIEATVDRVSLEDHPLAKRAKDMGSAAVMLALLNALLVWGLVLAG